MSHPSASPMPSRAWDAFDGYLFDIDGTLLNSRDAVHYFAFCESLSEVAGRPVNLDGVTVHGNVDQGILRDAWALAEVPETTWRPRLAEVRERMGSFVQAREGDLQLDVLPGVRDLLAHLQARGAKLATATGNLRRIGEAKLRRAGLLEFFHLGGWSDGYETRSDVFRAALQGMRELAGQNARIVVVGDTPQDVRAAKANGLEVIAVATGIYSFEQLEAEGPELCLRSFTGLEGLRSADSANDHKGNL